MECADALVEVRRNIDWRVLPGRHGDRKGPLSDPDKEPIGVRERRSLGNDLADPALGELVLDKVDEPAGIRRIRIQHAGGRGHRRPARNRFPPRRHSAPRSRGPCPGPTCQGLGWTDVRSCFKSGVKRSSERSHMHMSSHSLIRSRTAGTGPIADLRPSVDGLFLFIRCFQAFIT